MSGLEAGPACPIPLSRYPRVVLAHGGGGRLMRDLIERMLAPALAAPDTEAAHDAACLPALGGRPAFTTDSYVVRPLFFPGGDIGRLAVFGTVNDLAMAGARPRYLSLGLIVEEGLPMDDLWRVVRAIRAAADQAGVQVVTGDTKVVEQGKGDGLFINTAGIGELPEGREVHPRRVRPGDRVLLSGDLGRHGIALMAHREGLAFETALESDLASLAGLVGKLLDSGTAVHCLRDLTRGGLAAALVEIAESATLRIEIDEAALPVPGPVAAACELLGLDAVHVACEGRLVAFVPEPDADRALAALRRHPLGAGATAIGCVTGAAESRGGVLLRTALGSRRPLDLPSGEQLPRIC